MNIRIPVADIVRLFGPNVPLGQVYSKIHPIAERAGILFPEPKVGIGYLQWFFPGEDWISYDKLDDTTKEQVANLYMQRKAIMQKELENPLLSKYIFTIPAQQFIYVRSNAKDFDIALAAWATRFPNAAGCSELLVSHKVKETQKVAVGFLWNGKLLRDLKFKVEDLECKTSIDGLYRFNGSFDVGRDLHLNILDIKSFSFSVEKGKEEYVFDLTQYFTVKINALKDGEPLSCAKYTLDFNNLSEELSLDSEGNAELQIPLAFSNTCGVLKPQPNLSVTCNSETQEKTLRENEDQLVFVFNFITEEPVAPIPEKHTPIKKTCPKEEPKKECATIELLDYSGYPLKNLDFVLKTDKIKSQLFTTDENGTCMIPKEFFSDNKKFKIEVEISPEYQKKYDIHDTKEKK